MFSDSMMLGGGRKAAFSIANSVRLDGVADYFTRTPSTVGNRKTWTFSAWVKRSSLVDGSYTLLNAGTSSAAFTGFSWDNGTYANHLTFYCNATGANLRCSMLSRDVAAWYHLCLAVDTDLPDAQTSDRVRLYVNGQRVTAFDLANYPARSTATHVNAAEPHQAGKRIGTSEYLDGYVASPILVDGAALDPSHFGETDPVTGSWRPKRYVGSGNLPVYGADVTAGKTVSLSPDLVIDGATLEPFAIDDNPGTKIATNNAFTANTSRIIIDLGAGGDKSIARITTNQETNYVWTAGKLQYSDDGTSWSDAGSFNPGNSTSTQAFDFPDSGAHRYWALMPSANAYGGSGYGLRFNEIELVELLGSASNFGTNGFHLDFADAGGSGGTVNTAFAGGFGAYQVVINPARPLPNKAWITQIGVTQNSAESGKSVYIVRDDGGNGYTVMWVSAPFNHAGSGLQQVAVNYLVPETGTYLMAVDCPGSGLAWGHDSDLIGTPCHYSLTTRSLGESFVAEIAADVSVYEAPPALTWTDGSLGRSATGVNHWTPVSLGAADIASDSPTNNFATWNPLTVPVNESYVPALLTQGNLTAQTSSSGSIRCWAMATQSVSTTVKQWIEIRIDAFPFGSLAGKALAIALGEEAAYPWGGSSTSVGCRAWELYVRATGTAAEPVGMNTNLGEVAGYSPAVGDTIVFAYDPGNRHLWLGILPAAGILNWVGGGSPESGVSPTWILPADVGPLFPMCAIGGGSTSGAITANFGQHPFVSPPPAGFKSLCTANLPKPVIQAPAKHMDVVTYSGTGTARSISGLGFQPDLVWVKSRSNGNSGHTLFDVIRGPGKILSSSWSGAELTEYPDTLTSFNPDGFGLGVDVAAGTINVTGQTYVAWCWKAGGAAVANTAGSIASTVSANPTAGFSIVTYTHSGGTITVGHGLGASPKMVIDKSLSSGSWIIQHASLTNMSTDYLDFTTAAQMADASFFSSTAPSSTILTRGGGLAGSSRVAYCWAEVPGFSKFGSYTGNGSSDGPFVHCGFRPRWVLVKRTDATGSWRIVDTARDPYNEVVKSLYPNSIGAEDPSDGFADFTATGFKIRRAVYTGTYIYAAFAEAPLGGAKTVPAKAR